MTGIILKILRWSKRKSWECGKFQPSAVGNFELSLGIPRTLSADLQSAAPLALRVSKSRWCGHRVEYARLCGYSSTTDEEVICETRLRQLQV